MPWHSNRVTGGARGEGGQSGEYGDVVTTGGDFSKTEGMEEKKDTEGEGKGGKVGEKGD
jgi:hypothetical protein